MFAVQKFLSQVGPVSRTLRHSVHIVTLAALLASPMIPVLYARDGDHGPLLPPNSHPFGKSFEQWNVLYTKWMVKTYLGGQTPSDMVDGVRFLPNNPIPGTYEFNVHMGPGTPFVHPPFPLFGELYDDESEDDPNDPFIPIIFQTTNVRVVLDSHVLMDDAASELCRYGYGPKYFHQPIFYAEPQPRGPNLNSIAAIWTQGVGAVYRPLPVGQHRLVTSVDGPLGAYHLTYNIRVTPH